MSTSLSFLLSCLTASHLLPSVFGSSPEGLSLNFHVRRDQAPTSTHRKRDLVYTTNLSNHLVGYYANVTVGDPPQKLTLHIDTGSSDTWFPSVNSTFCTTDPEACKTTGSYDLTKSSTVTDTHHPFFTHFFDGSGDNGTFIQDTITVAGVTIDKQYLALIDTAINPTPGQDDTFATGILGIGYSSAESMVINADEDPYDTVLERLKGDGYIETLAYSIWLDSFDSGTGSILFGAVDESKYQGPLKAAPIVRGPITDDVPRTAIQMTSLTLNDKSGSFPLSSDDTEVWATFDTGATFAYLPAGLTKAIYENAGVILDDTTGGVPTIPCNMSTADANFTFGFGGLGGPQVSVPIKEFVVPPQGDFTFQDGTLACEFGVSPSPDASALLGDTFLRSVYAVFDLENDRIALAQSNFDAQPVPQQIRQIKAGKDGIPGLERQQAVIAWSPAVTSAYRMAQSAAKASGKPTGDLTTSAAAVPTSTGTFIISEFPPKPSFTAESAVGPTTTGGPDGGLPGSGDQSSGVMDAKTSTGALSFGLTMAAAVTFVVLF
ncbi:MAG: hypothetical protein Q9170_007239 [Blastenia crenularia]